MVSKYIIPEFEVVELTTESPLQSSFSDGDPIITPTGEDDYAF